MTEQTIADETELFNELETVREQGQGYARDFEEHVADMQCIAAHILSEEEVLGVISVSGPKSRTSGPRFDKDVPQQVLRTANVLEVITTHS